MKKLLFLCALLFTVPLTTACATFPTAPAAVAETTKIDEQAAIGANLAYKTWRVAVETGVNAGLIKGTLAGRIAMLDNQLYTALQAVDAAYAAGNSTSLTGAVVNFNAALAAGYAAIPGSK